MKSLLDKLKKITQKDFYTTRNGQIVANISASVLMKGINMVISILMVPIALDYLEKTRYGLWAALSSVLSWFFIFDVGIGNGLRNKFIEHKAKDDFESIKQYVSTAYFIFSVLAVFISIVFVLFSSYVDWSKLLNAPIELKDELAETVLIVFIVLIISFVLKLINTILSADMKHAASDLISTIGHIVSYIGMVILTKVTTASILKYALVYTGSNLATMLIASIVLFSGKYKNISPSISHIRISKIKSLFTVGLSFFTIQLALMAFTLLPNFMISRFLGPDSVTDYSINMRYFSMVSMVFTMMTYPLWSGFGDAYFRGDNAWISKTINRLYKLAGIIAIALIGMVLVQKPVFKIWLKGKVAVDYTTSVLFVIYYIFYMLVSINGLYVNALSKLRLQMIVSFPLAIMFLFSSIFLMKNTGLGINSVILCNILFWGIPFSVLLRIQMNKIMNNVAGIWNK